MKTRFEHTTGVAHLAKIVAQRPEFSGIGLNLYLASLAHDLGTPPFSHASEYFQDLVLGKNHEEYIDEILIDKSAIGQIRSWEIDDHKTHSIKEASVDLMEGTIKTGKMSAFVGSAYKMLDLNNSKIENASGHFKLNFDTLFGSLHILARVGKPETGTLQKGIAGNGVKIRMGFYIDEKTN